MKLLLTTLLLIPLATMADGQDKPDPLAKPEDYTNVETWRYFPGVGHLIELYPEHYNVLPYAWQPRPGEQVKPTGPNYWRYYDKYPCRGAYAAITPRECDGDTSHEHKHSPSTPIPEPAIPLLLVSGGLLAYWRRR